jgi:hypothetical protein
MGLLVNGNPIPDPSGMGGEVSDLDLSGERDATGFLHRDRVATKVPTEIRFNNIEWPMCTSILQAVSPASFSLTFPDPNTGAIRTGTYYAGNRKWDIVMAGNTLNDYIVNLSFSIVEY